MRIEYQFQPTQPYGLHDMRVCGIEIKEGNLCFAFENGFVKIAEPCEQVYGAMTLESIDLDFCTVFLLSKNGKYGRFQGQKLELTDFLEQYPSFSFEIVDELYGYHKVSYGGYLSVPNINHLIEMQLFVYYNGSIVYETA